MGYGLEGMEYDFRQKTFIFLSKVRPIAGPEGQEVE
jgi:hypothetical protein